MRITQVRWILIAMAAIGRPCFAQEGTATPDLSKINDAKAWRLVNVAAHLSEEDGKQFVRLEAKGNPESARSNAGVALVKGVTFKEGTIEIDLKGRNKRQGSFLGVTFHALDNKTGEIVYFRPFNFKAEPPFRNRAVQYVTWPEHPWQKLREKSPGVYENAVFPVPDPDDWFHARIEVTSKTVTVFVNDSKEPSLTVSRLTDRDVGAVGLWADIFDGAFANFKVAPK